MLVFMTFFADDSVLRWISAKMEIRRQNAQMEQYQKVIREMDKQIKMLSRDSISRLRVRMSMCMVTSSL